jgi:hypothetical protein
MKIRICKARTHQPNIYPVVTPIIVIATKILSRKDTIHTP